MKRVTKHTNICDKMKGEHEEWEGMKGRRTRVKPEEGEHAGMVLKKPKSKWEW